MSTVFEDLGSPGVWRVETISEDGAPGDMVVFTGPRAEHLAREYFALREVLDRRGAAPPPTAAPRPPRETPTLRLVAPRSEPEDAADE